MPKEVDSESDDDDMEDDEERPGVGIPAQTGASKNSDEGTSHTGAKGMVAGAPGVSHGLVARGRTRRRRGARRSRG